MASARGGVSFTVAGMDQATGGRVEIGGRDVTAFLLFQRQFVASFMRAGIR